ncbi:MAG: SDR family oxidoreductase [Nitrospirae bacterium]|nr:SDR family oxidoreductase [Nitrospirota bacterium]
MHSDISQPVALVTGGSRGIGRAIVDALAKEGWKVFFCSQSAESAAQASQELAARFQGQIQGRACDVGQQDAVDDLVSWAVAEAGRIDCLVNNAGIGHFGPVDEISGEAWRLLIRTNLNGAFYATRAVVPRMKAQGGGWIINIASLAGKNPFAGGAAYNASKFGMVGFSEASMLDLRPYGIRVAAILPGSVRTEFSHPRPGASDDWKLAPEDVARTVVDLLHHDSHSLPSLVELRPSNPP